MRALDFYFFCEKSLVSMSKKLKKAQLKTRLPYLLPCVSHCIGRSVLLILSLNHLSYPPCNRAATCEVERNGLLEPTFLPSRPPVSLVMHSWAILGGSYVNARVCFWLGGTKSTLYKCTLKQLPLLPTATPRRRPLTVLLPDWLIRVGKMDADHFKRRASLWEHMCRVWLKIPDGESFEKHYDQIKFYLVMKRVN